MTDDDKELPWLEPAVEDSAESGFLEHYRMAIIAAGIFVIVAFALIIWQVYSGGAGQPGGEVPLVKAEDGPVKVKPEEPGGMEIPDRDKLIYGQVAGKQDDAEVQHLRAGPEEPVENPLIEAAPADAKAEAAKPQTTPAALPQAQVSEPKVTEPKPAVEKPVTAKPVVEKPVVEKPTHVAKPVEKPKAAAVAAMSGDYLIQLGAFSERAKALAAWQQIQGKFSDVMPKLQPDVITIDHGAGSVLYRLQAGKLDSRASADDLCAKLKAKSQPCMVVHR